MSTDGSGCSYEDEIEGYLCFPEPDGDREMTCIHIVVCIIECHDCEGGGDDSGDDGDNGDDGDGGDDSSSDDPPEGGGGAGPGGDQNNPCDSDSTMPGLNECDECDHPYPPTWCEEEPEPCDTGNEVLDNASFQALMEEAATASGFSEDESERLEGFWAVYEDNGSFTKELLPYSSRSSCNFTISFGTASNRDQILDGAVALLHTHPYSPGEELITGGACLEARGWNIDEMGYLPVPGFWASPDDLLIMNSLELPLYTIDKSRIYLNEPGENIPAQGILYQKCGYN